MPEEKLNYLSIPFIKILLTKFLSYKEAIKNHAPKSVGKVL